MNFSCPSCGYSNQYKPTQKENRYTKCNIHLTILSSTKHQRYFEIVEVINFGLFGYIALVKEQFWYLDVYFILELTIKHFQGKYLNQTIYCVKSIYITKNGNSKEKVKEYIIAVLALAFALFAMWYILY